MNTATLPRLTTQELELDLSPEAFGELRRSDDIAEKGALLHQRMLEDGYLFLPGYFDRAEVLANEQILLGRLADTGYIDLDRPLMEGIAHKAPGAVDPALAKDNPALHKLLYEGRMIQLYEKMLDGPVRHFDFTWMRAALPGKGTAPHCDIVFMGRGTTNLFTAWTPLRDISLEMGGLMILENSHKNTRLRENYGRKDADEYCANLMEAPHDGHNGSKKYIGAGGVLTHNPVRLRERLGGRWLTTEFRAGDLLTFSMYTVHASLDNQSDKIRISSDTRYQLASEPADERWIGENPIGHGLAAARGRIC